MLAASNAARDPRRRWVISRAPAMRSACGLRRATRSTRATSSWRRFGTCRGRRSATAPSPHRTEPRSRVGRPRRRAASAPRGAARPRRRRPCGFGAGGVCRCAGGDGGGAELAPEREQGARDPLLLLPSPHRDGAQQRGQGQQDEPLNNAARVAPRGSACHQREPDEQRQCPAEGDDASEEQAVVDVTGVRARCDGTRRLSGVGRTVCIG